MNRRQFNLGFLGAAGAITFRSLQTIVTEPRAVATGSYLDQESFNDPVATARGSETVRVATGSYLDQESFNDPVATARGSVTVRVNGARLNEHLAALAEFGRNPQGGVSRLAYSEADARGREYVLGLMRAAKLEVSIDAAGNLIGRRAGSDNSLKPILCGSHIDSVPEGGNYDGVVGSLGAIEVAQALFENNVATRHPLEVVIFQNEEGGLIGSRAIDGQLTEPELDLVSRSGKTIREGIKFIGGDPARLSTVKREKGSIAAYLELHIEQGG